MSDEVTTFGALIDRGVLEIGDGYRAKLEELGGRGPLFLRASRVTAEAINFLGAERFREALIPALASKLGRAHDTIMTTKGNSIGRAGYVPPRAPTFVYSPHLSYWRSHNAAVLAPGFLRYWTRAPEFVTQLQAMAHSTDMAPYLSLTDQRSLKITLPDPGTQQAIAEVLGPLDDKIEINQRLCAHADKLVRLEVFRAQALAEETMPLGELVVRVNDVVAPELLDAQSMYVGLEHIPRGLLFLREWSTASSVVSGKARFKAGDILFGKLRAYFKKVCVAPAAGVCSTDIFVLRPRNREVGAFTTVVCSSDQVVDYAAAGSNGTRMPRVSWNYLSQLRLKVPDDRTLRSLQDLLGPMLDFGVNLMDESRALGRLRDALLPKLLSGEIRVRGDRPPGVAA